MRHSQLGGYLSKVQNNGLMDHFLLVANSGRVVGHIYFQHDRFIFCLNFLPYSRRRSAENLVALAEKKGPLE